MFAFSTVEHMGIILAAAGFATHGAAYGAVSQMLNHSITKSLCFYTAGMVLLALGTRQISEVRGLFRISPFTGGALLLCSLAIAGAPPFPIFLSEFSILSAGLRSGHNVAVAILAILHRRCVCSNHAQVNGMLFGEPESTTPAERVPAKLPHGCGAGRDSGRCPGCLHSRRRCIPFWTLAAQQLGGH